MTITILYIEDNPLNRRLVRKLLTTKGYQVLEAIDGLTGLEMIRTEKPDLVLLDVNLPGIDGLDIVKQLRTMPEIAHTPVIALTANSMHGDRERCLAAGCDAYLAKPIARQELYNMLHRFLAKKPVKEL
jgi:two-component system, cell cycle response regulator DivK